LRIARDPERNAARAALRQQLLSARDQHAGLRPQAEQQALLARLWALVGPVSEQVLALYWPIRGEVPLGDLPERWAQAGARLALPVVDGPDRPLRFVAWRPGDAMMPGAYGIPRPLGDQSLRPTLMLVPCLGFDERGYRLGYGGGYYDRTLALFQADGLPPPLTIGLAWDEARLAGFEPLPTDIALQLVLTPSDSFGALPGGQVRSTGPSS
jgi:5-formyltetrahydrofolate cyclo-ligase